MDEGAKDTTPKMEYDAGPAPTCPYCGYMQGHNRVCISVELAEVRAQLTATERERDDIAFRVEHPELAHLHYDGCPYKPYSDKRSDDIPDPPPPCTCGEAAKGAYWKGQHLLERGYHELTRKERDALREAVREAAEYVRHAHNPGHRDHNSTFCVVCLWLSRPSVQQAVSKEGKP